MIPLGLSGFLFVFWMEETIVFLDVGYLDKVAKAFGDGQRIKIGHVEFCQYLAKLQGLSCKKIFYYCAPPYQSERQTPEDNRRKAGYDNFVRTMRNKYKDYFIIREGRLEAHYNEISKGKYVPVYTQKGVDTWLTMDLLEEPAAEKVKTVILIMCDGDFVPVIQRIKDRGIRPILYCYINLVIRPKLIVSKDLLNTVGSPNTFTLEKDHFEKNKYIPKY